MVARRPAVRVQLDARGQPGDLHRGGRRHRPRPPDPEPGLDAHPCWSPDGRTIAFATDRWGGLELAAVRPDGTGLIRLTSSPGSTTTRPTRPTARRLAFVSNRDGQFEIYVAAAERHRPGQSVAHPLRDTFPTWTPDGRGVTFVSDRDGGFDLYTQFLKP